MECKAGILGACDWLAKELLQWLDQWHFPLSLLLFDEVEQRGQIVKFANHYHTIHAWDQAMIATCDILFDCRYTKTFAIEDMMKKTAYVIDLQDAKGQYQWIMPNINLTAFQRSDHLVAIPNAAFCLFANVYAPLRCKTKIQNVYLTSLHSVAPLGNSGCQDLLDQIHAYAKGGEIESNLFPIKDAYQHLPLLFQALPQTSPFQKDGNSMEETLFAKQAKRCFPDAFGICATCIRIAGLRGLSMNLVFTCEKDIELETMIDALASDPMIICYDDIAHNMYPICADVIHDYRCYIGRMRKSDAHTFTAWAVCDDLAMRCGAAVKLAFYIFHNFLAVADQ